MNLSILRQSTLGAFIIFLVAAATMSIVVALSTSTTAQAYNCNTSGPNKDGKDRSGQQLEYLNGNCVVWGWSPDTNNAERETVLNPDGSFKEFKCPTTMVQRGDNCHNKTPIYTSEVPTYDDGTEVPRQTYDDICMSGPGYWGSGSHYDPQYHACQVDSMCDNITTYNSDGGLPDGVNVNDDYFSGGPGCRHFGDGDFENLEDSTPDPTTAAVNECKDGGGIFDQSKPKGQQCSYTAESCTAKGLAFDRAAGACVKPPGYCDKYTDQAQKEACEKGQAGEDCNQFTDPAQKAACEDGGNNNPNTAGGPTTDEIPQVETRCGEARVNILICGEEGGNTALTNILRIVVMVLTVGVGAAAVGGLAWASILYAKAEDNEGNVSSAKELIRNVVIGLLLYVFLVAITNWLVPGGVIG